MARTTDRYRYDTRTYAARAATPLECKDDLPPCPVCKGLECLCRPRFFAGQLLGEQDLNRLDGYIRAKSRLHNRHLHGWGVVCGLEASCDGCGEGVRVSGGYALDPCGNDVVVCNDELVPVCALIEQCRRREDADLPCLDLPRDDDPCRDREEDWVLAVRYVERPSRGVTALRGAACTACGGTAKGGCSCKGSRTGGICSCGGAGANGAKPKGGTGAACSCGPTAAARPRGAPAECEPTITCESYEFVVYRVPPPARPEPDDPRRPPVLGGALAERFLCCWQGFLDAVPPPPGDFNSYSYASNPQAWADWLCDARDALLRFFSRYPGYDCEVLQRLRALSCPDPRAEDFAARYEQVVQALALLALEQLFACMCSALLPPCPRPANDDRIPLAVVTVRRSPCRIVRVCNWTPLRKVLVTWPNLSYWLSVLPLGGALREALHSLCCDLLGLRRRLEPQRRREAAVRDAGIHETVVRGAAAPEAVAPEATPMETAAGRPWNRKRSDQMKAFAGLTASALGGKREALHPIAVLAGALGVGVDRPALGELQAANPLYHVALSQLGRPLVEDLGLDRPAAADVSVTLRALEARLEAQAREIEELRARIAREERP